ncbi:MAG: hypothetical protein IMW98_09305 [Firmicutes bacterium]|nr:hypothetical protein [Bacillota bacterium]
MDWPRAKSLLILTFFALNVFLGYQLSLERRTVATSGWAGAAGGRSGAEQEIREAGVRLEAPLPAAPAALPLLKVQPGKPNRESLLAAMLPQGGAAAHTSTPGIESLGVPGSDVYEWGTEQLFIMSDVLVFYLNTRPDGGCPAPSADDARRQADEFLATRMGGLPPGAAFDLARVDGSDPCRTAVYYHQQFRGYPIWGKMGDDAEPVSGPIKVEVAQAGVASVIEQYLKPIGFTGAPVAILDPAAAVMKALAWLPKEPVVQSLELGYFSESYCMVESYEIAPVWRIRTPDAVVYINAYNGDRVGSGHQECQTVPSGAGGS